MTPYFQFISTNHKIFLKSVTLCLITHPYNPKYSRLQNKNRFHVNANGQLRMFTSSITLTANLYMDPLLSHWALNMNKIFKLILEKLEFLLFINKMKIIR